MKAAFVCLQDLVRLIIAAVAVSLVAACQTPSAVRVPEPDPETGKVEPIDPETLRRIEMLEAWRTLGKDRWLLDTCHSEHTPTAVRALQAVARIAQASAVPELVTELESPRAVLRKEAAFAAQVFALGQSDPTNRTTLRLEAALTHAEEHEQDDAAHVAQLHALAAIASPSILARISERLIGQSDIRAEAALQLGVAAQRGHALSTETLDILAQVSGSPYDLERRAATYALAQSNRTEALPALRERLDDLDAEVRAWAVYGLGRGGGVQDSGRLSTVATRERDVRVRAELVRALAAYARKCTPVASCDALYTIEEILQPLGGLRGKTLIQDTWPILVLSEEALPSASRDLWIRLRGRLAEVARSQPGLARSAGQLDCHAAAALDRLSGGLNEVLGCGMGQVPEDERLRQGAWAVATARAPLPGTVASLVKLLDRPEGPVREAAARALGILKSREASARLRLLARGPDLAEAVVALSSLANIGDRAAVAEAKQIAASVALQPTLVSQVAEALLAWHPKEVEPAVQAWVRAPHRHVQREGRRLLEAWKVEVIDSPPLELSAPLDAPSSSNAVSQTRVVLDTEVGEIEIELEARAPLNAGRLAAAIAAGKLDGTAFSTVSPHSFVAHGGLTTRPGPLTPDEPIAGVLEEGSVVMINHGRDTQDGAFQILTGPRPDWEGKVTLVGRVVRGIETARAVLPGTRIRAARIER